MQNYELLLRTAEALLTRLTDSDGSAGGEVPAGPGGLELTRLTNDGHCHGISALSGRNDPGRHVARCPGLSVGLDDAGTHRDWQLFETAS